MKAQAIAKSVGMSPRKVRLVVDLIRGRNVNEAYALLKFSKKAASRPIEKTLRSAVANAPVRTGNEPQASANSMSPCSRARPSRRSAAASHSRSWWGPPARRRGS